MYLCKICNKPILRKSNRCSTCVSKIRRIVVKKNLLDHKGGKCFKCGWKDHPAGLQFHHVDSSLKSFNICRSQGLSLDKLIKEIEKCIILCANCHSIEHAIRYNDEKILSAANEYLLLTKKPPCSKSNLTKEKKVPWNKGTEMTMLHKTNHPSKEELKKLLWEIPTTKIAALYNVSDTAVSKWAKFHKLSKPPRGYWTKYKFDE